VPKIVVNGLIIEDVVTCFLEHSVYTEYGGAAVA